MSIQKYGFVYIWFDKKNNRYYIGSHWGTEDDGYVCSSPWMHRSKAKRPNDFKRRVVSRVYTNRHELLDEEQRWLDMIKDEELATFNTTTKKRETVKYYNITKLAKRSWHYDDNRRLTVGEKISAAKKGKSTGPCSPEKAKAISEAKKKKFADQGGMSDEHKASLRGIKKKPHTDEWKQQNSERMKEQWSLNTTRRQAISEASKKRWEEYRNKKQEQLAS